MEGLKASMKTNTFLITFYVQNCCLSVQYFSNTKERILKNASLEGKNGLMLRVDILAIINRPVRLHVFLEHTGTGCSCCSTSIYFKDSDCSSFHSFSLHCRFLLENGSLSGPVQGFQRILKRKGRRFPAGGNTRDSPPRARTTDHLRK